MITAAFLFDQMFKMTFAYKKFTYDLYLDPGATSTWSSKNNKENEN